MVQTDNAQLTSECQDWRQILRNYRDEFQLSKKSLEDICKQTPTKENLRDIEHFDNQFHIQLINIHDLKQKIKWHEKMLTAESGQQDDMYAKHEALLSQFLSMENRLQELRVDFQQFISATNC